jgi:hypothetical protein
VLDVTTEREPAPVPNRRGIAFAWDLKRVLARGSGTVKGGSQRGRSRRRRLVGVAAIALLAAGCAGPGAGIAERIRAANSPIVREVIFSPAGLEGGGELVTIFVIDAATDAQELDLWCRVVIPAGAAQLPTGNVRLFKGGERYQDGSSSGVYGGLNNPTCPEGTTPTSS